MPVINITNISGDTQTVEYEVGLTLMDVLRDQGYEQIAAICGGCCSYATCHVHIPEKQSVSLPEIEEDEQMLIEMVDAYNPKLSRLSCQIELSEQHNGLAITIVEND